MSQHKFLFEPFSISNLRLRNRIIKAPMFTGFATSDGHVTPLMLEYYKDVAKGGAAMVVVANAVVDLEGSIGPRALRIDDDNFLPGLSKLAASIKSQGAVAAIQIGHGGRFGSGKASLAPSSTFMKERNVFEFYKRVLLPMPLKYQVKFVRKFGRKVLSLPKELTVQKIDSIISAFVEAALRAQKAGFDIVEIHGGTGYLPVQFLSPLTNKRKDKYGGSLENRMRFSTELVQAVKSAVGVSFPVGYRFQADERLEGGFGLEDAKVFARRLEQLGVAYLSVTSGKYEIVYELKMNGHEEHVSNMVDLAGLIKQKVATPIIATGGITTPEIAEQAIVEGKADLIGLARPLFVDPEWPQKAGNGENTRINGCGEDCLDCFRKVMTGRPASCPNWNETRKVKMERLTSAG
ncbi:MAG: NADH:flavin oxidoreductase [Deltaproteobacteria bacterium]|nr:NADH:flavin oxidoreductase [Deltaproteobacteria bacterium]